MPEAGFKKENLPKSHKELKLFLEKNYRKYNVPGFIKDDPLSIPHRFSKKEDIEISGFLTATIAWGNRKSIIKNAKRLMNMMENDPSEFVRNFRESDLKPFVKFVHRTFNEDDCLYFLHALQNIYLNHGGLENVFKSDKSPDGVKRAIVNFRKVFFELPHLIRTQKHVANPEKNSSAKRINMFLRWMVREDDRGVDFGLWNSINTAQLMCPLDLHSGNVSRKLGLLTRKQNDWKAVEELTENLRLFDMNDPVKYDFALFGLGVFENI